MNGTGHQAANAAAGMALVSWQRPSLQVGAALVGGMLVAARGPDQLEFRKILNGVRRALRPFKPRPVRRRPGELTSASLVRRGWDRFVLPHGPSEAFVERLYIRHRGPTHWLVPTGLVVAGVAWLLAAMIVQMQPVAEFIAVGVLLGYCLHPLIDTFNDWAVELAPGVKWCMPAPLRFRAGGFVEGVLTLGCTFVVVYLAVKLAPADWQDRAMEAGR